MKNVQWWAKGETRKAAGKTTEKSIRRPADQKPLATAIGMCILLLSIRSLPGTSLTALVDRNGEDTSKLYLVLSVLLVMNTIVRKTKCKNMKKIQKTGKSKNSENKDQNNQRKVMS